MKPLTLPLGLTSVLLLLLTAPAQGAPESPFHFAHRGGRLEFEENTMHAFQSCYEKGIRGYELDVRMTKDGALVVLHDNSLNRTHEGTGPVEHLTAEEAKGIRTKETKEPLLFLDTLLEYLKDKEGMYVEFEMKTSTKELYPDERIDDYVAALHKKVTAHIPKGSTYLFTSFDTRPLLAIKKIDPLADTMLIHGGPLTPEVMEQAKAVGAKRIGAIMEGTTRKAVKEAQQAGFIITGWPGRNLQDYFLGLGLGVDAICTDVPVLVQEYIESKANAPTALKTEGASEGKR